MMGAFDLTIGPLLLGFSIDLYLYGIVSYQYLAYKTMKFADPIWLRTLVALLFVVDTLQTSAEFYAIWYFAVENYTNPSVFGHIIWVTPLGGICTTISSITVQGFLIHRLHRLTKQFWLCIFLIFAASAASLFAVIDSIMVSILVDMTKFGALIPLSVAWLIIEAGVDIIITVVLSRALWRSKTGFTRTNTVVNRCVRASIQSGFFSSVFAIAIILAFAFWPSTYLFAIFGWPLGRIYSNSLLYTLVARRELSEIAYGTVEFRGTGSNSFPMSPQTRSIHSQRETVSRAEVADNTVKASLDQYIVFSPSPRTI
ncbi:hypothetical protein DL96DRAFT_156809 [Flagelloscypha sp. PMI_526]|nr:hypothetical protein DL96DRAFT_156809 [Flagelloscypha sp. PMI_526]